MKKIYFISLLFFIELTAYGQQRDAIKGRGILQHNYITERIILPKHKTGPLKINTRKDIDSLFLLTETAWKSVSADTLKKYPQEISSEEFNNLDAYVYLWTLVSMAQNTDVLDEFGPYLAKTYMIPAMRRDLETVKRSPTIRNITLIHSGSLVNTLSMGSKLTADKETFNETYSIFSDYGDLFRSINPADTAVSNYAREQLKTITSNYYAMNARKSFYDGDLNSTYNYLITGLSIDNYSKSKAIDLSKKLLIEFEKKNDKDRSFALLNALAVNTTSESINRDSLLSSYLRVDMVHGKTMFDNVSKKLASSAFKKSDAAIKLPQNWNFVVNGLSAEKAKKAKYILVDLWYTGCGPCLKEIPELNTFQEKIKARDDIMFLSVNTDYINGKNTEEYVSKRSNTLSVKFPVFYDNSVYMISKQLGVTGYPAKFILSSKGEILAKIDQSSITLETFEAFLKEIK